MQGQLKLEPYKDNKGMKFSIKKKIIENKT